MKPHVTLQMNETREGSPDGLSVHEYLDGETYSVPPRLAKIFVDEGWADLIDGELEEPNVDEAPPAIEELTNEELIAALDAKLAEADHDQLVTIAAEYELPTDVDDDDLRTAIKMHVLANAAQIETKPAPAQIETKPAQAPTEAKPKAPARRKSSSSTKRKTASAK